jgi:hypothetical protein
MYILVHKTIFIVLISFNIMYGDNCVNISIIHI